MILPSGSELKITVGSFAESKALYQAILEEAKDLKMDAQAEVDVNLFKDLFCTMMSSKKVESALWGCMRRVTYNGLKITESTFEDVEARQDYFEVCFEVAKENILPFTKSLYAKLSPILDKLKTNPA